MSYELCLKMLIPRYHDGTRKPFNGARKLDAMVKFGSSAVER